MSAKTDGQEKSFQKEEKGKSSQNKNHISEARLPLFSGIYYTSVLTDYFPVLISDGGLSLS